MGWGIFMLSIHYKHKRNIKRINKKIEERVNRPLDEHDMMTMEEEVNQYWRESEVPTEWSIIAGRRTAMVPYDEVRPKTDKLSPKKKMGKHTMR